MPALGVALPSGAPERRLVVTIGAVLFIQSLGASAIVPLLPTYLEANGSSAALVGAVMGSYFLASVVAQVPIGRLVDRVGEGPVLRGGLVVFAGGCVGFALTSSPAASIAYRALQGLGAGAVVLAGNAAVAARVKATERGSAFATTNAARMLAFAAGPLVGSAIGASSMRLLFLLAAGISLLALPVFQVLAGSSRRVGGPAPRRERARPGLSAALIGAAFVFGAAGLVNGLYESCWSLLLHRRHAPSIAIGLSWTLYCFPFALMSGLSGRLADRADRRLLAIAGTVSTASFAAIYPLVPNVPLLVGLGCLEAVGAVIVTPAALSILAEATPPDAQGSAQGAVQTAYTATTAAGALGSGALFGVAVALPFEIAAAAMVLFAGMMAWWWRGIDGRVVRPAVGKQRDQSGRPEVPVAPPSPLS